MWADIWAIETDIQLHSKTLAHCTRQKKMESIRHCVDSDVIYLLISDPEAVGFCSVIVIEHYIIILLYILYRAYILLSRSTIG
jgi:hypothetical protein